MPELTDLTFNPTLTNVSLQYKVEALIWSMVLPPIKVGSRTPRIRRYTKDDRFRIPNDVVGARSRPNQVDFGSTTTSIMVEDRALEEPISEVERREAEAEGVMSLLTDATEFVTGLIEIAQEKRVADRVFAAATYPTGNKVTLSGTSQWNDETNSNPLNDILTGLDAAFVRPNVMVLGADPYRHLRKHPKILDAVKGRTGVAPRGGIVSPQDLADLFELQKVLVGRSRINSAKEGQTATYTRLWGKHCALLYVEERPTSRSITFGATFSETLRKVSTYFDNNIGPEGSTMVRVYWNGDEEILAPDVGYFIENAVA